MEEIHQFDGPSLPQGSVVYPSRFIIQFQYDWINLCSFCNPPRSKVKSSGIKRQRKLTEICFGFGSRVYWAIGIYKVEKLLEEVQCILVNMKAKGQNFNLKKLTLFKDSTVTNHKLTRNLVSSNALPGTG